MVLNENGIAKASASLRNKRVTMECPFCNGGISIMPQILGLKNGSAGLNQPTFAEYFQIKCDVCHNTSLFPLNSINDLNQRDDINH